MRVQSSVCPRSLSRRQSHRLQSAVDAGVPRWVAARQGFNKGENNSHRKLTPLFFCIAIVASVVRSFNRCAQKKVVWTFEFKRNMSSESIREAEAQIQRDYAAVVGVKLRRVLHAFDVCDGVERRDVQVLQVVDIA
jgi:hypothetical protein